MSMLRIVAIAALTCAGASTGEAAQSTPSKKVSCRMERVCQPVMRPVREVVSSCAMISPGKGFPPRKLCTEHLAHSELEGPQLCRSTRICKPR
ncbi:hypothetical protein ACFQU1_20000 [Chelatococcus sp. GCM10030263]|uniref:hypothetical protein n=1 Tax=Chelatococcus sp. GCM10030263 TaxID=3273387 RepID=UPI003619077E